MSSKKIKEPFDKSKEYKEIIEPILNELRTQCLLHAIPMFVTVGIKGEAESTDFASAGTYLDMPCTEYKNMMNDVKYAGFRYSDDNLIGKHLLVQMGCIPVAKSLIPMHNVEGKIFDEDEAEDDEA